MNLPPLTFISPADPGVAMPVIEGHLFAPGDLSCLELIPAVSFGSIAA
jgi:hypothetical protein